MKGRHVEVQPKRLLQDIETLIRDTFPKSIHLNLSLPRESWTIMGDPTQLHQILLNLSVNARDAMPNGGKLTISVENVVLNKQTAAKYLRASPGRYVTIIVTDSGTGISAAILDKIFEPFFTTKEVGRGTGLGLSSVPRHRKKSRRFCRRRKQARPRRHLQSVSSRHRTFARETQRTRQRSAAFRGETARPSSSSMTNPPSSPSPATPWKPSATKS